MQKALLLKNLLRHGLRGLFSLLIFFTINKNNLNLVDKTLLYGIKSIQIKKTRRV